MKNKVESSLEIEKRFIGRWRKTQFPRESILLTQMQFGSGTAEEVLGEFLSLIRLPYYSRIVRHCRDEIEVLLSLFNGDEDVKFRIRKYGDIYGAMTVKTRHGIKNGFKEYIENSILVRKEVADFFFAEGRSANIIPVEKRRSIILGPDGKPWDNDRYEEENSGLILNEFEAGTIGDTFMKPQFIGPEITNDKFWKPRLSTAGLQKSPISTWDEKVRKRLFDIINS